MKLGNLVRYALSDLRHRLGATSLNVAAVALAAAYILVLGFYGASIHRFQGELLEQTLPTKIVAAMPDVTESRLRLTEERLAQLAQLEGVRLVLPRVELNVRLSIDGSRALDVPAEGTVPGDPSLEGDRLAWGAGVSAPDAREVVLTHDLYEKLGGLAAPTPSPARLLLEVSRTVGGREELQRLELEVVGLLGYGDSEKVHVPVELVATLDLWCTNRIGDLQGGEARRVRFPSALAYAPDAGVARVEQEARALQIEAGDEGALEILEARAPFWAVLERRDGAEPGPQDEARAAAVLGRGALHEVRLAALGDRRAVALAPGDPRWSRLEADRGPGSGTLLELERGAAGSGLAYSGPVAAAPADWPVDAELVTDLGSWPRLLFDPRGSDGVQPFTLVETRDPRAGARLSRERRSAAEFGRELGWLFLRAPGGARFDGLPRTLDALGAVPGLDVEPWYETSATFALESRGASQALRERRLPLRFLPRELYRRLTPGLDPTGATGSCLWISASAAGAQRPPVAVWIGPWRVPVVRGIHLEGARDGVWMTLGQDRRYDDILARPPDHREGVVAWGPWGALAAYAGGGQGGPWSVDESHSLRPGRFLALLDGPRERAEAALGELAPACALTELIGVRVRPAGAPAAGLVLVGARPSGALDAGLLELRAGLFADGSTTQLSAARWSSAPLEIRVREPFPPGLAVADEALWRDAAFAAATRRAPLHDRPRYDVRFEDALDFATAERDLQPLGLGLRPLAPIRQRSLYRYRVTDPGSVDGDLGSDLVTVLGMSQPTFVHARPELELEASFERAAGSFLLSASDHRDPERFAHAPLVGHWLRQTGGQGQVIVPRSLLADTPDDELAGALGMGVSARFERRLPGGGDDSLAIPLEVVGVSADERAFVPLELLASVRLWQASKLLYNETRGVFETPAEVSQRNGYLRCNVFADDADRVASVVASLRELGYRTEDSLGEQASLRRLGRILVFIIGFFVLGCVLNASITVLVATMMNVKSKIFEIGILRAHGLRVRQIVGIFASQGLAIGALAFAVAVGFVAAVEPLLRGAVRQAFNLEAGTVLVGSPFQGGLWWLSATAFSVAILFSFCGVVLPAAFACRLSPVEALRRRE